MSSRFHPQLVNEPFGDPGLYVDFMFEKRAILFDLGDISVLPGRKLLRISDIFISHLHMDHFCGFDHLLRTALGREQRFRLYGPAGLVAAVGHKLAAYSWNLIDSFNTDLCFSVSELVSGDQLRTVDYALKSGFQPTPAQLQPLTDGLLLCEDGISVRASVLDHGIDCLAFALSEQAHVNIWKARVEQMGLQVGPWLSELKRAILNDAPDETPILPIWQQQERRERQLTLGALKPLVSMTPGWKIAYVVDAAPSAANGDKIAALASGASHLFIETPFLHEDAHQAHKRNHLTARFAGQVARRAGVERLITQHYSPRYEGRSAELEAEAQAAFNGDAAGE